MNKKVVDAAFSFEINGMKMSMACTDDGKHSAASSLAGSAILASIIAMISMATF
jgi:hypothetical protein